MEIFNYDPASGEYLGPSVADPDQLSPGNWLIPAFASTLAPPAPVAGKAIVFAAGAWSLVPDHRGETWYKADRSPALITGIGDPSAEGLVATQPPAPPPPPPTAADLVAYAAAARWKKETGGISVSGIPVATDDRSKLMIVGARVAASADANWSTQWQGGDGNVYSINAVQMIAISDAVSAHVDGCFTTFASVKAQIAGGAVTTLAAIDSAFA